MKVTLNLASKPYVDLRSVLRRLRLIMVVLVLLAVPLFFLLRGEQKKAHLANIRVSTMQTQIRMLENRQHGYEVLMRQQKNAAVLRKATYLNGLFRRKSFSWTATMTDLETVLPGGVQVLSLDPAVTKNGDVVIHLRVSGPRDRALQLVQNLEKSRHFASPRLAGETLAQSANPNSKFQPISASSLVNFDILANYRPLSNRESEAGKKVTSKAAKPAGKRALKHVSHPSHKLAKPSAGIAKRQEAR